MTVDNPKWSCSWHRLSAAGRGALAAGLLLVAGAAWGQDEAPPPPPSEAPPPPPTEAPPPPPTDAPPPPPAEAPTTSPAETPLPPPAEAPPPPTMGQVLEQSTPSDWQPVDPAHTLVMELPSGRVVIALAPELAPRHVANIRTLVAEGFFDGLAIVRSQDNYVVQWGDPAPTPEQSRSYGSAVARLEPEFSRPLVPDLHVTYLQDPDPYAPRAGFAHGLPVGVDPAAKRIWAAHCYGMVGVGRGVPADSGNGAELYVVIGHAPRHLDRNVTLVGRVIDGIEHLSTLPRGGGPLGFYEDPSERVPIASIRLGTDPALADAPRYEALRTDTETFRELIAARRSRHESWFVEPTGRIGLCNVPLPVRAMAPETEPAQPAAD